MANEINTELALQLKNGDKSAFEIIFKSFFEPIVNFADEYICEFEVSRNIAQTVFMKLWENRNMVDPEMNLKAYLYKSTRNLCISHLRHLKIENAYFGNKKKNYEDSVLNQQSLSFLDFDKIDLSAIESIINFTIETLPERCKETFLLSRFDGLKNSEIAEKQNISIKAVEANITRALKILRKNLKDYLPAALIPFILKIFF